MSRATSSAHHLSPKGLHTRLGAAWPAFEHGDYDSAVFQAMKAVEVTVREVAGLSPSLLGVTLMRKAFHPDFGRLSDFKTQHGERQARRDLFAGAIGSFKNPHSHRDVLLDNPAEAAELMLLANHLLRITDASAARRFVSASTSYPSRGANFAHVFRHRNASQALAGTDRYTILDGAQGCPRDLAQGAAGVGASIRLGPKSTFGTKRKCRNAPGISGAGRRPAVPFACRPRRPLTPIGHVAIGSAQLVRSASGSCLVSMSLETRQFESLLEAQVS
jgi:uncharacterized protein (TIGR02391 family)